MPGTSPAEAMRVVAGELPDFPHLPELPERGPGRPHRPYRRAAGRDPGRGYPARLAAGRAARPGPVPRQDHALLRPGRHGGGLDGFRGPLKIQLCGPWTLAATLELPRTLNVAIADPGAVADLTASLAEGAAAHAAEVAKRVPGAQLIVQFDEPALSAVAGGEVPTASGLSRIAPVEADVLRERLAQAIASTGSTRWCTAARRPSRSASSGRRGRGPVLRPQPATARGR